MKRSLLWKILLPVVILLAGLGSYLYIIKPSFRSETVLSVRSEAELYNFYEHSRPASSANELLVRLLTLPFSLFYYDVYDYLPVDIALPEPFYYADSRFNDITDDVKAGAESETEAASVDYSETNLQVENVDEADVLKTDGRFLYSLSGSEVVITDVSDSAAPRVVSRLESSDSSVPVDLILSDDTLVVISEKSASSLTKKFYSSHRAADTVVRVYRLDSARSDPRLEKTFTLYEPYYTSRRLGSKLFIISSGSLRLAGGKVDRTYEEDYETKEFAATSVQYLKDLETDRLTLIAALDLANLDAPLTLSPFLLDAENAYVSESAIYLLDTHYVSKDTFSLKSLFGLRGVVGFLLDLDYDSYEYSLHKATEIFKFKIDETSSAVSFSAHGQVSGSTLNQYSLDESGGLLRLALESYTGGTYSTRIAVLDDSLSLLGESSAVGRGERMKSSRFLGDKAYLVTYRNTDPLFVVDLSSPSSPKVLGELNISGYSAYLHPYDETHLLGIGVDTEETTSRDENGRLISTGATVEGLKMSLFDVSDFSAPKEVAKISFGDSLTSSAILTNAKALLFSREKEVIAIPTDDNSYRVFRVNLSDGFSEKGIITHADSSLIRGAYIGNSLVTVSEKTLMINDLASLAPLSELSLTTNDK